MATHTLRAATAFLLLLAVAPVGAVQGAGGLALLGQQRTGVAGVVGLNGARALALSPDGAHLYAASDLASSVVAFARDGASGALTFVGRVQDAVDGVDGLDRVRAITISPDGANLYAVGERDDALAVFVRNPNTGTLAFLELKRDSVDGVDGLDGARAVVVSPDGAHVYAAGAKDNAVALFRRHPATGALTFVELQRDGVNGVNGLNAPEGLALSPDGLQLYVASPGDNSVAVFARDPVAGTLTFVERQKHDATATDGLDGVHTVVVSPDGANLYAGGKLDDSVAIFTRDSVTGTLTFVARVRDTVDGVDGLDGVEALAVSSDGQFVYAAASIDNSVAVFQRQPGDGTLTFVELQRDGVGTIDAMGGPKAVLPSPDGLHVYVAAAGGNSVTVFGTGCGDGILGPGEECDDGNAVGGDGCSPGCRRECSAPADCNDGDPCTEEHCRTGECATPRCGFAGAVCELNSAGAAMQASEACSPVGRPLGRTIRENLRLVRHAVQQARHQPKLSPKTLTARLGKMLVTIDSKTDRLQQRGRISTGCAAAVHDGTAVLRTELGQTLQRKGLCAS